MMSCFFNVFVIVAPDPWYQYLYQLRIVFIASHSINGQTANTYLAYGLGDYFSLSGLAQLTSAGFSRVCVVSMQISCQKGYLE